MNNDKLTADREIHAAVRAMFRLVYPRLNDRRLEELDVMVSRIYDMAGIELETCRGCDSDFIKGWACDYCTPPATQS